MTFIASGRGVHLEDMRRELKFMELKPIASLEHVEERIADFINTHRRYEKAGGTTTSDAEKKADLLAILPKAASDNLLWKATDGGSFFEFCAMIIAQSAKVLQTERARLGRPRSYANAVTEGPSEDEPMPDLQSFDNVDGYIAALTQWNKRGDKNGRRPPPNSQQKDQRGPRKCPNCGGVHESLKCPHASVDISQRPCWNCGKVGHRSSQCPSKQQAVKLMEQQKQANEKPSIEQQVDQSINGMFMCEMDVPPAPAGFDLPARRQRVRERPMPSKPTLGPLIQNAFSALSDPCGAGCACHAPEPRTALDVGVTTLKRG